MSAAEIVSKRLQTEEGFAARAYRDTKGVLTIGYGFAVDRGITQYAAAALMGAQVQERSQALQAYAWYSACDEVRQSVLLDIAFNAGLEGLLHFVHMLAAVGRQDWQEAKAELLDSDAARDAPKRYAVLAQLLLDGAQGVKA